MHQFKYQFHDVRAMEAKNKCFPFAAVVADRLVAFNNDFCRLAAEELPADPHVVVAAHLLLACGYEPGQEKNCQYKPEKVSDVEYDPGSDDSDCEVLGDTLRDSPSP